MKVAIGALRRAMQTAETIYASKTTKDGLLKLMYNGTGIIMLVLFNPEPKLIASESIRGDVERIVRLYNETL